MSTAPYTATLVSAPDGTDDIRLAIQGKTWHLWGRKSTEREMDLAQKAPVNTLPVLIGSGLGYCLNALAADNRPVAVIDRETPILEATELRSRFAENKNILWIDDDSPQPALDTLTQWQAKNANAPMIPLIFPLYLRLDRAYYGALADTLKTNQSTDFWSQARYPKFRAIKPRVLFLDSNYFLCGEILSGLKRLGVEHQALKLDGGPTGSQDFIEQLLKAVIDFKPDFVLTVNHFGLDRQGKLAGLLADLGLPLASWFVDNPHLILHDYTHPGTDNTAIFTYDAGNLDIMNAKGFSNVHYLPLATDPNRFRPGLGPCKEEWKRDISFVGNSMVTPVENSLNEADLPLDMRREYEDVAEAFGNSGDSNVAHFLKENRPKWHSVLQDMPTPEHRLALESLITWEATLQYRHACVRGIMTFTPLIVGDEGWKELIQMGYWRHLPSIDYYADLPRFYPCPKINFNCTSRQMIGAVNQRIFDVPACGAFVLTDYRDQMEDLFDLEKEVVVYNDPKEISDLVHRFLKNDKEREIIAQAARKRILAHHTYELRLSRLLNIMHQTFC